MEKTIEQLRYQLNEQETKISSLKRKKLEISSIFLECQKATEREKDIWEKVLYYTKGAHSKKQVQKKLLVLEERQNRFRQIFDQASDEIDLTLKKNNKDLENIEENIMQLNQGNKI